MATRGLMHTSSMLAANRCPPPARCPIQSNKLFTLMKTSVSVLSVCAFMSAALPASAQPIDIRQGAVAYWPLDVAVDGITTPDATPYANNLNIVGTPVIDTGKFGNAFTFNGSSTYLSIAHSSDNSVTGLPIYPAGS